MSLISDANRLSAEKEFSEVTLPPLILGPIKYPIGEAFQLLRDSEIRIIQDIQSVKISMRVTENCYLLDNNEKIIITVRKKINRPENVDGILRKIEGGSFEWMSHKLLDKARTIVNSDGLQNKSNIASETWLNAFKFRAEKLNSNGLRIKNGEGLRPPQLGALFSIGAHWSLHSKPATVVMPTGTGKTEIMLAALASFECSPLVIATPTKTLRDQTANKFLRFGLLRELKVLEPDVDNPVVGIIKRRPKKISDLKIFEDCNALVSVMSSLSGGTATLLSTEIAKRTNALFLDEAHHIGAKTWSSFREAYTKNKVLQFTATPFRRDGKLVDGDIIYTYPLKRAQEDGYFKPITFCPIHELNTVNSDMAIAKAALAQLNKDLSDGKNHLVMARCQSIDRAIVVQSIYKKLAPSFAPLLVHSNLPDTVERIEIVRQGNSKIVVCVDMLGEGFDLPELKIAAIHDPHKSLSVILQFIGRFTRSSGRNLGDATAIANVADPDMSESLERLYSEDSDWNSVLSELSSEAAKDHSELIDFLNNSEVIENNDDEPFENISHHLIKPTLSTLFYHADLFSPKRFYEGLPKSYQVIRVWINDKSKTLFFVTHSKEKVKWSRSKEIVDTSWDLFILHFDEARKLMYFSSTEKTTSFDKMARAVGATEQISGEQIFRCLGNIGRLVFQNLGVTKHGRRNLSYAMYTGSDVRQALSLSEKSGSRKSNLSGNGWECGRRMTIGCSYKGRVWSRETGSIPKFIHWAEFQGNKIVDEAIDTEKIIENVLIPDEITTLPEENLLGAEWPVELFRYSEEKLTLHREDKTEPFFMFDIYIENVRNETNEIIFSLIHETGEVWGQYVFRISGKYGFAVQANGEDLIINIGRNPISLSAFFSDYPPLFRYIDLSELDGNLILRPKNPQDIELDPKYIEAWNWDGTNIKKESLWKADEIRKDSIQWTVAQKYINSGYPVVFDDDGAGEAADLVCINEEEDHISLVLIHCKYSGGDDAGSRVKDVVEVSSQAIRSTKWSGRFRELCTHLQNRNERRRSPKRSTFLLSGEPSEITRLSRAARFKEVRTQIIIVQPGISKGNLSRAQSQVLASAVSYLKETVNVDLDIVCSE